MADTTLMLPSTTPTLSEEDRVSLRIRDLVRELDRISDPTYAVEVVVSEVEFNESDQTAKVKLVDPTQSGVGDILIRCVGGIPEIGESGVLLPLEQGGTRLPRWAFLSFRSAAPIQMLSEIRFSTESTDSVLLTSVNDVLSANLNYLSSGGTWGISPRPARADHHHDTRYPTTTAVNSALAGKADTGHTHALADLSNVTGTPSNGQVLTFTGSQWMPQSPAVGGGGGGGVSSRGAGSHYGTLDVFAGPISTSLVINAGQGYLLPIDTGFSMTITGLGLQRGSTNSTSARVAIYASNAQRLPTGTPLREATISLGTASGRHVGFVTSLVLAPGRYWIALKLQAATNLVGIANGQSLTAGLASLASEMSGTSFTRTTGLWVPGTNYAATWPTSFNTNDTLSMVPSLFLQAA